MQVGTFIIIYIILSLFVSLYSSKYSSDADEYRIIYESINSNQVLFYETGRAELIYYFWNWICTRVGLGFEYFLFFSTLLFMPLKIGALHVISGMNGRFRSLVIYLLIFFLLHECIQYKIAWAVSIALWACVFFSRRKWFFGGFLTLIAAGFHISVIFLPLSFLISYIFIKHYKIYGLKILLMFCGVAFLLIYFAIENVINIVDVRYFDYFSEDRLSIQNSSGLFYFYAIGLTLMAYWVSHQLNKNAPYEVQVSNFLMYISVAILYVLHQYVSMASRLSDVFLVMVIPLVNQIIREKRKISSILIVYLFAFIIFIGRLRFNWQIL